MKWKRVAGLVLAFSLFGSSMIYADTAVQKIRLIINGQDIDDGGYMVDGRAYVPVRELNGLIDYDEGTKRVAFTQPNVDIFLFKGDTPFGKVSAGKLKFNVFCQIDSLKVDISSVKVTIKGPDGSEKSIQSQDLGKEQKDNFWFRTHDYTYDFKTAGKYTINFYMKMNKSKDYVLVSEKVINAIGG
ncbi:copper amine oxidase N-terminal domain-containing protein [Paenibacillus sp. YPG26]|uniref:copper amine oxidase N-terminal domain-containing protein n=1 Tax=Paenibacillus sp. YPG26 TaxID=2878915 RepID=UPI00203FF705|nr:copper amine oxidase N-terminal domain-containing protein [Paenibacillus sp. YPG26]USB34565.1 copper amine oxidase N-terminal domain-containing protein [Paenibacillus sp. YPG26]